MCSLLPRGQIVFIRVVDSADFSLYYTAIELVLQYIILPGKCQASTPLNRARCISITSGIKKENASSPGLGLSHPFDSPASPTSPHSCSKYMLSSGTVTDVGIQ